MKKILFVAAVISLLNACSESVYELPNGSAGGTNNWDEIAHTPCNMANDKAFCTDSGNVMRCENNEWALATCSTGCKDGACIDKEQIKEESCKGEEIYSWCTADGHSLAFGCKHTHVKESGIIISTMTCAAGCNETTKECYDCDKDIKCCKEDDNTCQKICIDHRCIPKTTLSCMRKPTFKCDQGDSGQTYTLYCNESAIEGFVNVQCEGNKKCSENHQACVECINDGDCEELYPDKPTCNNGVCEECPPEHDFDPEKNECVERFKCPPEQIIDPDSNECIDKCGMDGVKAYLKQNESAYKEYGITADVLNDACIISYDEDREQTVLSCGKLNDTIEDRDIIFCGTVYLDKFDGLINSIKGRKIFGVHDATITSHEYTQIHKPLFGVVTNSTIYNLKIRNIQFNDIGNDEQAIRGIIEKMEGTEDTPCEIENISIENVSIVSNANSSKPMGGLIGEANYLSAKGISVDNFRLNVTESQGNVGGLFGYANKVTFNKPTINGITINALKPATQSYEDVGGVIGQGHDITISGGDINNITIASDLNDVGGLIGDSNGVVINPNADETLNISVNSIFGYEDVGGLIGEANKSIEINNGSDDSVLNITTKYVKGFAHVGGVIGNSNNARLSLHHIRNTTSMIYGNCCAAGFIDYVKETDEANNEDTMDIVIDDIYNECDNTASECIYNAQRTAGFIGYFGVSAMASASITNIINYFPNATMSATDDAAGFIGYISIDTDNSNSLTINNIISNVGKVNGTDIVGGFIAFINFGDAGAEEPQLMISDVTSNAVVFASDEDVSENTQLYNIAMTYFAMGGYLANKLKMDDSYIQNKGAGFVNTIGNDWYTNTIESNDLTNRYMHKYNYCCTTPSSCIIGHASCGEDDRYYKWPPIFEMNFYENAFTSKLSISNIAVKHDTQSFDFVSKQKHNGYNTLSRYIEKINQRACAGSDKDGLMKSLDQINAFNSIYRKNIFIYSTVDHGLPSSPPGREKELYSVNHTYSYPLNDCDYADFNDNNANNIYIMYDKYCDVGESRECTKNNMSEIDALTDMTKENAYHVTEVPNLINSEGLQTWHFDKTLGLPVPSLKGNVVKQAEPLPFESIEPIDPDDSREPAPDSPVEP